MALCEKCGKEAWKVVEHSLTGAKLCLKCLTQSGFFKLKDEDLIIFKDDRRGGIRIPLSIKMSFIILGDNEVVEERFNAAGVNLSTSGICFTWDSCYTCNSYTEGSIHPKCIFYPYFIQNSERRELQIEMMITRTFFMKLQAYTIYTLKDPAHDQEFVGAQFVNTGRQERLILEKILMEYGNS